MSTEAKLANNPAAMKNVAVKEASSGGYLVGCVIWTAITSFYVYFYLTTKHMTQKEFSNHLSWELPATMSFLYLSMVFLGPKIVTKELTFGGRLKDIMISKLCCCLLTYVYILFYLYFISLIFKTNFQLIFYLINFSVQCVPSDVQYMVV